MIHILIGIGVLAGLIGFSFGSGAARIFVGAVLGVCALAIVSFGCVVAYDYSQIKAKERAEAEYAKIVRAEEEDLERKKAEAARTGQCLSYAAKAVYVVSCAPANGAR
jgi:phosphotransferase system  glucose/maltose/N-acetylglucosamine-specific IIC component